MKSHPIRVLLIAPHPYWHPGTQSLMKQMLRFGIRIDAYDYFNMVLREPEGKVSELGSTLPASFGVGKAYKYVTRKATFRKLVTDYDVVDIHFVDPHYSEFISEIRVPLISTLFGSDLYRSPSHAKSGLHQIFENSSRIVLGENMVNYFNQVYPGHQERFYFAKYGSDIIEYISQEMTRISCVQAKEYLEIPSDAITIAIGYNGIPEQQHLRILKTIYSSIHSTPDKVHLLLQMTYGGSNDYFNEVKSSLARAQIPHTVFTERLSEQQLARLRLATNVTINMQTTDAQAGSIKESLFAGSYLLVGDWLPYKFFEDRGIKIVRTDFENLATETIRAFTEMEGNWIQRNRDLVYDLSSWNTLSLDWAALYRNLHQEPQNTLTDEGQQ